MNPPLVRNRNRFDFATKHRQSEPHAPADENWTVVPRFQDISIKRKLTAIIMIATTVALLLVSGAFVAYQLFTFRQTLKTDISALGTVIGDRSTAAISFEKPDEAQIILGSFKIKEHITGAALYDR